MKSPGNTPSKITALLVDDEASGRSILRTMLSEFCPEVEILGEAGSAKEGAEAVRRLRPDLVFLDVQMPVASGFAMLEMLGGVEFQVIFTTAHDQYAIQAIRNAALDYLLKPLDIAELQQAVARMHKLLGPEQPTPEQVSHLLDNIRHASAGPKKVGLPSADGLVFVNVADIIRAEADGSYTRVVLRGGEQYLISRNLKGIESLLDPTTFFRVHHSHLINLGAVKRYIRGKGGQVVLEDGSVVDVSVRRRDAFLERLSG